MPVTPASGSSFVLRVTCVVLLFAALVVWDEIAYEPHHVRWVASALFGLALVCRTESAVLFRKSLPNFVAAALLAVASMSLAWSVDPAGGAMVLVQLAVAIMIALCLANADRNVVVDLANVASVSTLTLVALYWLGIARWAGLGNPNFLSETLVGAVPLVIVAAQCSKGPAIRVFHIAVVAAAAFTCIASLPGRAGAVAMILVLAIMLYGIVNTAANSHRLRILIMIACLLLAGAAAFRLASIGASNLAATMSDRFQLWLGALSMISDNWILGIGMGSFDWLYPSYQESYKKFDLLDPRFPELLDRRNLRAGALHNEYLQYLTTFGIFGSVSLIGAVSWVLFRSRKRLLGSGQTRFPAFAGLAGIAALSFVGFPFQIQPTQILVAILFGFLCRSGDSAERLEPAPLVMRLVPALVLAVAAVLAAMTATGQHFLGRARMVQERDPAQAWTDYETAYRMSPWSYVVRTSRFVGLVRRTEVDAAFHPERALVDAAFRVASEPVASHINVLCARVQYLLNFAVDDESREEAERLLALLKSRAASVQDVWILAAAASLKEGDGKTALGELAAARARARRDLVPAHSALLDSMEVVARELAASPVPRKLSFRIALGFDRD